MPTLKVESPTPPLPPTPEGTAAAPTVKEEGGLNVDDAFGPPAGVAPQLPYAVGEQPAGRFMSGGAPIKKEPGVAPPIGVRFAAGTKEGDEPPGAITKKGANGRYA